MEPYNTLKSYVEQSSEHTDVLVAASHTEQYSQTYHVPYGHQHNFHGPSINDNGKRPYHQVDQHSYGEPYANHSPYQIPPFEIPPEPFQDQDIHNGYGHQRENTAQDGRQWCRPEQTPTWHGHNCDPWHSDMEQKCGSNAEMTESVSHLVNHSWRSDGPEIVPQHSTTVQPTSPTHNTQPSIVHVNLQQHFLTDGNDPWTAERGQGGQWVDPRSRMEAWLPMSEGLYTGRGDDTGDPNSPSASSYPHTLGSFDDVDDQDRGKGSVETIRRFDGSRRAGETDAQSPQRYFPNSYQEARVSNSNDHRLAQGWPRPETSSLPRQYSNNSDDGNIDPSNRPHATSPVASSTVESASSQAIRCELCDGEYSGKYARSNLGRHKRSKHDGQPQQYDCKDGMCDKTFLRSDARLKHYRTCHPDFANAAVPRRQLNTVSDPAPDPEVLREIWDP